MTPLTAASADPAVVHLLAVHPFVRLVEGGPRRGLTFVQDGWKRAVQVGQMSEPQRGILEIMDNNPLVCADSISVPSGGATLALIALGPLAAGGLIVDSPTIVVSQETEEAEIAALMEPLGWFGGSYVHQEPGAFDPVVAATVMVAIRTPDHPSEIGELFEERYGRTFYVRNGQEAEWNVGLVAGKAHAFYRMSLAQDEGTSLLTVRVIADRQGKAGAAQVVHAMNVMAGFEESLGVA